MIPKRAIFFWEGREMSWLRRLSLDSFRRWNPEWKVTVIDGNGLSIPKGGFVNTALRSDWARLKALRSGGFYFDTDIIFLRPIPSYWLDGSLALSVYPDGLCSSVGWIGAAPNNPTIESLESRCSVMSGRLGCQSMGIKLWQTAGDLRKTQHFVQIPYSSLIPVSWENTERLWDDWSIPLDSSNVGLHWFGGDRLSEEMEPKIRPESLDDYPCPVTKACVLATADATVTL